MLTEERAKTALASFQQEGIADTEQFVKMLVASRGNYQTLLDFRKSAAECDREGLALPLLQQLSAKDWRDVSLEVLEDHLKNAPDPQETDLWACAEIANPRVENEMLTPYRSFFKKVISKEEAGEFIKEPIRLVEWCKKEIQINNELNSQRIPMSPIGVWKARVADEKSRDIFFVAMARTLGIPARIDKVTGKVQYTDKEGHTFDVNFSTSSPVQATTGILRATYKPIASLPDPKYYSHFTLSKFKDGVFQLLNYDEGDVDMGKGATWANLLKNGAKLDSGYYMLVTGSRMASGAVLSNITFFNVKPEATTDIELVMRESKEQVQVIGNFDSESLYRPLGDEEIQSTSQSILQTCGRGYFVVGVLGVGQEPTNHALRDIAALGSEFEKWGRKIVLLFPSEEQYKKFHPAEFQGLPSTIAYG